MLVCGDQFCRFCSSLAFKAFVGLRTSKFIIELWRRCVSFSCHASGSLLKTQVTESSVSRYVPSSSSNRGVELNGKVELKLNRRRDVLLASLLPLWLINRNDALAGDYFVVDIEWLFVSVILVPWACCWCWFMEYRKFIEIVFEGLTYPCFRNNLM